MSHHWFWVKQSIHFALCSSSNTHLHVFSPIDAIKSGWNHYIYKKLFIKKKKKTPVGHVSWILRGRLPVNLNAKNHLDLTWSNGGAECMHSWFLQLYRKLRLAATTVARLTSMATEWWRALWKPIISLSCQRTYEKICCPPTECWAWLKGAAAQSWGHICRVASKANIAVTRKHSPECRAKYRRYDITYYLMWSQQTCTHGKFQWDENVRSLVIVQASVCHRVTSKPFCKRRHFLVNPTSMPTAGQSVLASEVRRSLCQHFS